MLSRSQGIEEATEKFTQDIRRIIQSMLSDVVLDLFKDSLPKLPKRRPLYLGPSKTRPKVKGTSVKELSPQLRTAYSRIRKAKRPVTSKSLSKSLKVPEGKARRMLGQLLSQSLLRKQPLGDGTARRVYLPSK